MLPCYKTLASSLVCFIQPEKPKRANTVKWYYTRPTRGALSVSGLQINYLL